MSCKFHEIDWCGVLFMVFLCITVPTCIYQQEKTAQMKIESEVCDCVEVGED